MMLNSTSVEGSSPRRHDNNTSSMSSRDGSRSSFLNLCDLVFDEEIPRQEYLFGLQYLCGLFRRESNVDGYQEILGMLVDGKKRSGLVELVLHYFSTEEISTDIMESVKSIFLLTEGLASMNEARILASKFPSDGKHLGALESIRDE